MKITSLFVLLSGLLGYQLAIADNTPASETSTLSWPAGLPVYDHIVIVVEENKDYHQIIGNPNAPYINDVLKKEGANFTQMYAEEHLSQGNYFWMFSGSNQDVGFDDQNLSRRNNSRPFLTALNLGEQLIKKGLSFKGYAESLPYIGFTGDTCGLYARKHVPWISFTNVPNDTTVATSSNLRFSDFPSDPSQYHTLPTVAFVIPNIKNDMHDLFDESYRAQTFEDNLVNFQASIMKGDYWLRRNIDSYYQWAKHNNSLLIFTFDESYDDGSIHGLTNPSPKSSCKGDNFENCNRNLQDKSLDCCKILQNRTVTIFAGAHIKPGDYPEGKGITHVNILRTIEAMYGLSKAGKQQVNAAKFGISDDYIITDVFKTAQ